MIFRLVFMNWLKHEVVWNPIVHDGHRISKQMESFVHRLDRRPLLVKIRFKNFVKNGMPILVLKVMDGIQWNYGQAITK